MQTIDQTAPLITADRWATALEPRTEAPPSMRVFGLIMLIGFGVLGGLLLWSWTRNAGAWRLVLGGTLVTIGVVVCLWALASPRTVTPVYHGWMRFGLGLGTVVSTVLLSLLYFIVITPVGALMRLTGTDPLERRLDAAAASYWTTHARPAGHDDYVHMS
jgi:hypothetical protein